MEKDNIILFANSFKQSETSPDFKGELTIDLKEFKELISDDHKLTLRIAAFKNISQKGNEYITARTFPPFKKEENS